MGVTSATHEFKSSIPAGRMYKAIIEESPTIFPKFMPNYKSEVVQGDGGVGTILQTCFHDEDPANYHSKYTLIEGGALSDNVESVVNEVKIDASGDGCVVKAINHYHTKGEADKALIESIGQQTVGVYKALQEYLLANPSVCA
ncbi:Major allergen Mal d 1 [Linum perenne]